MKTTKELKKDSKKSVAKKTTAKKNTAKKPAATKKVATKKTVAKKTPVKKTAASNDVVNKVEQPTKSNAQAANKKNKFAFAIVLAIVVLIVAFIVSKKSFKHVDTLVNKVKTSVSDTSVVNNLFDIDVYNEKGTEELVLPEEFRVYHETDKYDSAVVTIMNLISYYSRGESTVFDEEFILGMKSFHDPFHQGTCVKQIEEILETLNVKYHNNLNYRELPELRNTEVGVELLKKASKAGYPVIVGWSPDGMNSLWSLIVSYNEGETKSDITDDEIVVFNIDSSKSNESFEYIKATDFEDKWDFADLFVGETEAHERAKNCFIITEKYE